MPRVFFIHNMSIQGDFLKFRKACTIDADQIMLIIGQAQAHFKANGVNQWQNGYPNAGTIKNDIQKEYAHVLTDSGTIIGTVSVCFDGEKSYEKIYDGKWLSCEGFAVIHRLAIEDGHKGKGLSSFIIKNIEKMSLNKGVHSIKVDTHEQNLSMQKLLLKNRFVHCGTIHLSDMSKRIAFEKLF